MTRVRRSWAGLAVLVALVAGCSAIPTAGEVHEGDGNVGEPGQIIPQGALPGIDATPEEILRGFLAASPAGVNSAHQITREYLTLAGQLAWEPWRGVTVYRSDPRFAIVSATTDRVTYTVTMPVAATVDEQGLLTEAGAATERSFEFELESDASGQWRIDTLPDAVLLNLSNFDNLYRSTTLYFPTPEREFLVPDVRWFPRDSAPTFAVQTLLESGPAPWLRDAVLTGQLGGTRLEGESVLVDATGTAVVDLNAAFMDLPRDDQALVIAQLEAVLLRGGVGGVSEVRVQVQGVEVPVPADGSLQRDPAPDGAPVALDGEGQLVILTATGPVRLEDAAPLDDVSARSPAQGSGGFPLVLLSGSRQLVNARGAEISEPWVEGRRLVAPSVDRFGWVWTTPEVSDGTLVAARSVVEQVSVQAEWLEGREVRSLRVSRDGARVVIVSAAGDEGATVDVAAVTRDRLGRPQRVGVPHLVGAVLADATQATWVDESTLAVLGTMAGAAGPTVALVPVDGLTASRGTPSGGSPAVSIATGKGERAVFVTTEDGGLWQWRASSWEKVADGVYSPAFPG